MGVRPFEMGKQGLDLFRNEAPWIRVLLLDHDAVPRKDSHAATQMGWGTSAKSLSYFTPQWLPLKLDILVN